MGLPTENKRTRLSQFIAYSHALSCQQQPYDRYDFYRVVRLLCASPKTNVHPSIHLPSCSSNVPIAIEQTIA